MLFLDVRRGRRDVHHDVVVVVVVDDDRHSLA
jgi:hypothetical protein